MPIRLKSKFSKYGQVTTSLDGVSSDFDGTYTPRTAITGLLLSQIGQLSATLRGVFRPISEYTGAISAALSGVAAAWRGSYSFADNPPYWSDQYVGQGDVFSIQPGQTTFSYTFQATDLDGGDEIQFSIGPYDASKLLVTEGPVIGNQRTLTISNAPNAIFTESDTYDVTVGMAPRNTEITTLTLDGAGAWTYGHAFKDGDTAPASYVSVTNGQAEVRNRWPSGCVKFAVLSGISTGAGSVSIRTGASDTMLGPLVAEPTLTGAYETSVDFGATYGKATLNPQTIGAWDRTVAHRVRSITGPVMSEFHYYAPATGGSEASYLGVWWYVRAYSNGQTEVETVVENGWLQVADPKHRTYTPVVKVNGVTIAHGYGSVEHRHHSRWSRHDWTSGADLTPTFDMAYWRASKLVPNYGWNSPSETILSGLFTNQNPTPMSDEGFFPKGYGQGGNHPHDGLLANWTALAFASGDPRAIRAAIAGARVTQRYAIFYRDETTGRAPLLISNSSYNRIGIPGSSGIAGWDYNASNAPELLPTPNPGLYPDDAKRDSQHACQDTYGAYLLTGRWSFIDHAQLLQMTYMLAEIPYVRRTDGTYRLSGQPIRGYYRMTRDLALAIAITPDSPAYAADAAVYADLKTQWALNMYHVRADYCDPAVYRYHPSGWMRLWYGEGGPCDEPDYQKTTPASAGPYWLRAWQTEYGIAYYNFIRDIGLPVSAQATQDLEVIADHLIKIAVGITQDGIPYRRCGSQNNYPIGFDNAPPYLPLEANYDWNPTDDAGLINTSSWARLLYEFDVARPDIHTLPPGNTLISNQNVELKKEDFNTIYADGDGSNVGGGHFGDVVAAVALAANHNADALAGYNRLAASTTWASKATTFNNYPMCGIAPR